MYIGNKAEISTGKEKIVLTQETNYPWDGDVTFTIESLKKPIKKEFRFRIPEWCKSYTAAVNGEKLTDMQIEKGYLIINQKWKANDKITLALEMPVEMIQADPRVKENTGKRAVQKGPLVYCVEEADNLSFDDLMLSPATKFKDEFNSLFLNGITTIDAITGDKTIRFIPYYSWDNREAGQMKVWVDYNE